MSFLIKKIKKISEDWFGGSDYYRVVYTIYVVSGIWMLKKERVVKGKYSSALFSFLRVFAVVGCLGSLVCFLHEAYLIRESIEKLTYNISVTIFLVASLIRLFFLIVKKDEFEDMHDVINMNLYLEGIGTTSRDQRILRRGELDLIKIARGFYILQVLGLVFKVMCHAVNEKTLPIPLPFFGHIGSPIFEIFFVLEVFGFTHFISVVIAQTLVTYGILIRISRHYLILAKNISDIGRSADSISPIQSQLDGFGIDRRKGKTLGWKGDWRWEQEKIFDLLKKNVIHHQEILKVLNKASYLLQESFFFEIFGGGMLLVDLFFHVTLNLERTENAPFLIANQFTFCVSALLDITITCYYCSQIQSRSMQAANALYSSNWLGMDLRNKKTVRFMQMAMSKQPTIKAGSFSLSLGMYVKFLQSIYSYFAFMQNVV